MPRTKLDRLSITPAEIRARIIRSAAARQGLHKNKDLADLMGVSESSACGKMRGHTSWSVDMLCALVRPLQLTDEEILQFVKGRKT